MCTIHSLSVLDSIRQGVLRCEHWKIWGDTCQYHSPEHIMGISGRSKHRDTAPTSALHMVCVYIYTQLYKLYEYYMAGTSNRVVSEVPQLSCSAVGEHHVHWARLQDSWERDENVVKTWFSWKKLEETMVFTIKYSVNLQDTVGHP